MKPEDVPAELVEAASANEEIGTTVWPCEIPAVLAAVLPEHERQVRERIAAEMPETCRSCAHLSAMHRGDGCWFTVQLGSPGRDLVCPCAVPARIARGES